MANLDFCDQHNMVTFLKKPQGSTYFHQIVDFLNSTHIKYALTENPIIYVSLIRQFWQTASSCTSEDGKIEITATIDERLKSVTEASIRRHLKLEDYNGPIKQGEGSTVPVESHPTPAGDPTISQPPIKSPSRVPSMPHDSPFPGGHTPRKDEYDLEDPSKQERKIAQIDEDERITLVQMVTTAGAEISTACPEDKTAKISDDSDDITLAETLIEIRRSAIKPQKIKGVAFRDVEETPGPIRPLPSIDPKDKEFDEIQARMDADHELATRLTHEEQEQFTIKERESYAEKEELRAILDIVPRDDIAINVESLATKYPIVDWKTHILTENMMYDQIIRGGESFKNYKIFSKMLDDFDRQDVIDLYRLVQESMFSLGVAIFIPDPLLKWSLSILMHPFAEKTSTVVTNSKGHNEVNKVGKILEIHRALASGVINADEVTRQSDRPGNYNRRNGCTEMLQSRNTMIVVELIGLCWQHPQVWCLGFWNDYEDVSYIL
uniref:Xylulose kinase-1 n=1 Tax=Tanacetum cinerariifolium TaxID=118510 RepID=A0A6L2K396_TANCI|nr:hypothetical protein [Tanacetum cinerariifolium]